MTAATRKKMKHERKRHKTERAHFFLSSFSSFPVVFSSLLFLFSGRKDYVKTMEKKDQRERRKDLD